MGFVESLKGLIYDILHNLDRINVDYITSNGLNPLRIRHDSGGIIEFKSDGKAYYNGTEIVSSSGGTSDHGALTGLADDDHTQYLPLTGSRAMSGDLTLNSTTPRIVLQEGGSFRGALHVETDDSVVLESELSNLSFATTAITGGDIIFWPEGVASFTMTATGAISYQPINIDSSGNPLLSFSKSASYRGAIGIGNSDQIVIESEHGGIVLGTYAGTGGTIDMNPKDGGVVATFDSAAIDFTQPLDMNGDAITDAAMAGTNSATFKINQDNAGVEASAIEFDRGSVATAARILWSEANDWFSFEAVTGSTAAKIIAGTMVTGDHGTAATDEVVNVCYGTSATPPTASTTTEGALYIQYTA